MKVEGQSNSFSTSFLLTDCIINTQLSRDSTPIPKKLKLCVMFEYHLHFLRMLGEGNSDSGALVKVSFTLPLQT